MIEFLELTGAASALMWVFIFVGTIIASFVAANISYHTQMPIGWLLPGIVLLGIYLYFLFLMYRER